ncbi:hypothetical protein A2U01_0056903, partial [Trifolium medium]|nr:hypothetical protein [Trifolium medium]
ALIPGDPKRQAVGEGEPSKWTDKLRPENTPTHGGRGVGDPPVNWKPTEKG